jgi:phospholipid transport system substrate-binding protein
MLLTMTEASMKMITARRPLGGSMSLLGLLAAACALLLPAVATQAQPNASTPPDALVRLLSNDVLDAIKADKTLQTGDVARLNKLIDEKILPYVNFEKMTQLAVGRGWRQATPEQRQALTVEFRQLLVRTYAGAVSQITDHKVEMKPFRAQPTETDVLVRTAVVPSRGEAIQLDYRVEKGDAGWKIYDVNVAGVWLVENYRSSFSSEINQGGIDGLIKSLTERNRALAGKK